MKHVDLYTDGACSGNPGKGGYGFILCYKETTKEFSQGYKFTTNNRMEMMAVIYGLKKLKEPCEVTVTTDSRYVLDGMTKWIFSWLKKGIFTNNPQKIKNADLWKELYNLSRVHKLSWQWIKGHNEHPQNERCDELARNAAASSDLLNDTQYELESKK